MIRGMITTIDDLVPDTLWQTIQPLLPTPPRRYGGRPRIDDRACLAGIVYQLRTGIPWRLLPVRELGGGCGTGNALASGSGSTTRCSMSSAATASSTGHGRASTRPACAPSGGRADRPEPDRPRQARLQVPPAGRPARQPAGGRPVGGQHPRLAAAGTAGRCRPRGQGPAWPAGSAAAAARQAPHGQGRATTGAAGVHCGGAGSPPGSPAAASSPAAGWAATGT
jgi:hypothetical protein